MGEGASAFSLDALASRMARASWSGATLAAAGPRAQINLRARGEAARQVASILHADLEAPNRVVTASSGECYWLGPEEWLWVGSAAERGSLLGALEGAIGPDDGAAVDVSASRVVLDLSGISARDVLATCCALDLHPRVFGPGRCAQTLIAKAPVLLHQVDSTPTFRLLVRPSLVSYVVSWILDGMDGVRAETEREVRRT